MPDVLPTFDAGTWDHLTTIQNDLFMNALVDPAKIASPTFRIMWDKMVYEKLNVDDTFLLPLDLSINPTLYAEGKNVVYQTRSSQKTTRGHFEPAIAYSGDAITEFDIAEGGAFNDDAVLIPELMTRQKAMNKGLTSHMMYEIWAKQGYTAAGGVAAEPAPGATIVIPDIIQNFYADAKILNKPASVVDRFTSLPSTVKPHGAGHTYGGISSENLWWRNKVFYISDANAITEIDETNYTNFCVNVPTDNVDLVTQPIPAAFGSGVAWSFRCFDLWFDELQQGGGYELYVALPPTGYSALLNWVRVNQDVVQNEYLTELGVTQNFKSASYNVTYYSDPTMRYIYPNSAFAYDPETTHFVAVLGTCPLIKNWTPIPGSSSIVCVKIIRFQLICTNPVSAGALHNIRWD